MFMYSYCYVCSENRVLRRVFGPKRDEVTGEWRKLRNEELNDLYSLPNIGFYTETGGCDCSLKSAPDDGQKCCPKHVEQRLYK
jgi:hypothetical protein